MTDKKYKLTKTSKVVFGTTLFQIEALISFGNVTKGDKGGWIEKEENLAQVSGDAWVSGNARVSGNAQVYGNAWVYGKLKLLAGFFFGYRYQKEEIKFKEIDENYDLIYKGDAKFGEEEEKSLSGKEVEVKLDGKTYKAIIQ